MSVRTAHGIPAILLALALAGCGPVLPKVQYKPIKSAADMDGMTDAFNMQRSVITIELSTDGTATISSTPREATDVKYAFKAISNSRTSTVVTLSKIPNSDMVSSADVEVTDNTAKMINEYGAAAVKILGLLALGAKPKPEGPCFPAGATPLTLELGYEDKQTFDGPPGGGKQCITVTLKPLPPDRIERSALPPGRETSNFYYSACRDAEVVLRQSPQQTLARTVRIADPRYLQFVQFPPKGTVTMHSACGVSVKTEKGAVDNTASIVDALAAQGKAIKDALEASKK